MSVLNRSRSLAIQVVVIVGWVFIVTHYHADHIYGLQEFKKMGAKIIAHPAAKEYLYSDTAKRLAYRRLPD